MGYFSLFILAMLATFVVDICWTLYLIKVQERRSVAAGIYATLIYLLGALVVTIYVTDKSLIIPALIGSFLGTFVAVEYKKRVE